MPTAHPDIARDMYLPLSPPLGRVCWVLAALMLWLSLSAVFDAVAVFHDAIVRQPDDLTTVTFRIIHVASRTPNFKVRFADGTTALLSFPDKRGGNPKGGLTMSQLTGHATEQLTGCLATAKVRSVLGAYGRINQVWDLACPQAHLHYGPEQAASAIREQPRLDLALSLVFGAVFLLMAFAMAMIARKLMEK